jgi:crossover junction endodeoxyribonuclease RuvC
MNDSFIIIGVDPGSVRLGYAVLVVSYGEICLESSGVIIFEQRDSLQYKLFYVFSFLKDLALKYISLDKNVYFSVESQFVSKNVHSSFVLVSFSSIIFLLSELVAKTSCMVFSPLEVKKLISGSSLCKKEDIFSVLQAKFNSSFDVFSFDESDAIAIAYSGCLKLLI